MNETSAWKVRLWSKEDKEKGLGRQGEQASRVSVPSVPCMAPSGGGGGGGVVVVGGM